MRIISFCQLSILVNLNWLIAQETGVKNFEEFASKQTQFFVEAYEKRDTHTYKVLMAEFLGQYDLLSEIEKHSFRNYYANAYYNLACTYALLKQKSMAIHCLEKAIQGGFSDYQHIQNDSDLKYIKNDQSFNELVKILRDIGDYLHILRKGFQYNENDHRHIPKFTYQNADDARLSLLRKSFNLDSIAGHGNDVSKVINLLHWIHYLIPHDGMHENPVIKNAMNMIAECKKEKRGLNCRGLATVLNECYLALGFKSRFITCLPKDSLQIDPDCHVINTVYIPALKKWIWLDPTNDAYVMNELGELLSIDEVRERLISGAPLILNPDANWNRQVSKSKEEYLYQYMAKNLYMLQCNVDSSYDSETTGNDKKITRVTLLPIEYFKQTPDKTVTYNEEINTTFIHYKTNNQKVFWAVPE